MPRTMSEFIGEIEKYIEETGKGPEITIYVKPNSDREELVIEGGELVFYTTEPPVQGRANASLIRYLSRNTKIPSSRIEIVYGWRSRTKKIIFKDVRTEVLAEKLAGIVKKKD